MLHRTWATRTITATPTGCCQVFTSNNGQTCVELGTENAWLQVDSILEPLGELWSIINQWVRRFTEERAAAPAR